MIGVNAKDRLDPILPKDGQDQGQTVAQEARVASIKTATVFPDPCPCLLMFVRTVGFIGPHYQGRVLFS